MSIKRSRVLVMADWFEPGFKAGGPIRSCVNFAVNLKQDLEIFVLTTDRDLGDDAPYAGVTQNTWVPYEHDVQVFYASPEWLSWKNIRNIVQSVQPDIVYLNSMFSKYFSLYPLLMKRAGIIASRIILSPRGMLKESALRFKSKKKKVFLNLFRVLGLQRNVHFHCTDNIEQEDVKKYFGKVGSTLISNMPGAQRALQLVNDKSPGSVKLIFTGRIHPIKNLQYLLELLGKVKQRVELTVIGGEEDKIYSQRCLQAAEQLPANIKVKFAGELPHQQAEQQLLANHLFVLPTQGENFGHAIFESLAAGRPVLISDQTPWRHLSQHHAGWDVALSQPQNFVDVIEAVAAMNGEQMNVWCKGAWTYCNTYLEQSGIKAQYLKLFN